jgi:hypothetical protein
VSEEAIRQWVDWLGSSSFAQREVAVRCLRQIGSQAFGALEEALESKDPEVRSRSRVLLEEMGWVSPRVREKIMLLLEDLKSTSDDRKRQALYDELLGIGKASEQALREALTAPKGEGNWTLRPDKADYRVGDELRLEITVRNTGDGGFWWSPARVQWNAELRPFGGGGGGTFPLIQRTSLGRWSSELSSVRYVPKGGTIVFEERFSLEGVPVGRLALAGRYDTRAYAGWQSPAHQGIAGTGGVQPAPPRVHFAVLEWGDSVEFRILPSSEMFGSTRKGIVASVHPARVEVRRGEKIPVKFTLKNVWILPKKVPDIRRSPSGLWACFLDKSEKCLETVSLGEGAGRGTAAPALPLGAEEERSWEGGVPVGLPEGTYRMLMGFSTPLTTGLVAIVSQIKQPGNAPVQVPRGGVSLSELEWEVIAAPVTIRVIGAPAAKEGGTGK